MPGSPSGYLIGRRCTRFSTLHDPVTDVMIAAERLDGIVINGRHFSHCTFANVSFKDAQLTDSEFNDCAFVNCYFRKAQVTNCRFIGSKFLGCDFPRITVQACDFKYASFSSCAIPFGEMEHNLPPEPNIREDLSAGIAVAAEERGWSVQAKKYRLAAIAAREEHLEAAVKSNSNWYQEHYSGWRRVGACGQLIASKLNGFIWGYGERWWVLLRNLATLAFIVFPALLWLVRNNLVLSGRNPSTITELVSLSLSTIVPLNANGSILVSSDRALMLLSVEAFCGIVIAGLFVSLVLRWIMSR